MGAQEQSHQEERKQETQIAGSHMQGTTIDLSQLPITNRVFIDAAWKAHDQHNNNIRIGLGVLLQVNHGGRRLKIQVWAIGHQAKSAFQAEAQALVLAANLLD